MQTGNAWRVAVGAVLCCALGANSGKVVAEQFPSVNISLYSQIDLNTFGASSGNDCWGYVSPSGREYALMGVRNKVAFVEITDPANPNWFASISHPSSIWADIKVYQDVAYVVTEQFGTGIQVIDMSDIDLHSVTLVRTINAPSTNHNIAVDTVGRRLYTCGSGGGSATTVVFDLSNPTNPVEVGAWDGAYEHDAQIVTVTAGDYAGRVIMFGASTGLGVDIIDVTDPANTVLISRTPYPNVSYSHQVWTEDLQYLFVNDELDSIPRTTVLDISDLANPIVLGDFNSGVGSIDHNLYVHNGFVFEANYRSGLRIFDANENPTNPPQVGWFDTYPENDNSGFDGAWSCYPFFPSGTVIVSDLQRGLFVLDVSEVTGQQVSSPLSPLPENSLGNTTCAADSNCANEAYCVPDESGGFPGTCYVPKNRYLSVAPNPTNDIPTARRLSVVMFERSCGGTGSTTCTTDSQCAGNPGGSTCDDARVGSQVIGWFGEPGANGYVGIVDEASRHYASWADLSFPMECGVDEICPPDSYCDVGLGASNTCRSDADGTEVVSTVVQLTGCHISPKKRDVRPGMNESKAANYYLIEAIAEGSDIVNQLKYSQPLELPTVVSWGDMTGGTQGNRALPPDNTPGFTDVLDQVLRFKNQGRATTPWLDLHPQVPDRTVGFVDMLLAVGAFKDEPYPGDDPCTCAGLAPCN